MDTFWDTDYPYPVSGVYSLAKNLKNKTALCKQYCTHFIVI